MRILELIVTMDTGGAERMLATLALELQPRGHAVHIVCLQDAGIMPVPEHVFRRAGIQLTELKKGPGFSWKTASSIAQYCRLEKIDVIHGHSHQVNHYAAAAAYMAGVPAVVNTVHGISALEMQWWAKILFRLSCFRSNRVVGVCEAVSDAIEKRVPLSRRKVETIYNGIAADTFLSIIQPRIRDGQFVFGTVGRLVPVKNQHLLIESFASVYHRSGRCRLEILGFGELQCELEQLAARLGVSNVVTFHGMRLDVPAFLSTLDCFVLSSDSEGLPMTLLEAMAAGLPVITTAVGGMPEVIEQCGCGWICPPADPRAMADAMESVMAAPDLHYRGALAREAVQQKYSAAAMADRYVRLFHTLTGTGESRVENQTGRLQRGSVVQ